MGIGEKYALGLSTYLHLVDGKEGRGKMQDLTRKPKRSRMKINLRPLDSILVSFLQTWLVLKWSGVKEGKIESD